MSPQHRDLFLLPAKPAQTEVRRALALPESKAGGMITECVSTIKYLKEGRLTVQIDPALGRRGLLQFDPAATRPVQNMDGSGGPVYRFGVFELDPENRELRKRGVRLRLRGQPFEVLAALLERPGEIVSRDDLKARLWPENTFVEFDRGLNTAVQKIRQALGDTADAPRFVETVPRQGYRFLYPVETTARIGQPADRPRRQPLWLPLALLGAAIAIAAVYYLWQKPVGDAPAGNRLRVYTIQPKGLEGVQTLAGMNRPVISPDGRYIVYQGQSALWIYDTLSGDDRPLNGTGGSLSWPAWSPDSAWISYTQSFELVKVDVRGGRKEKVTEVGRGPFLGHSWRPDGTEIVYSVSNRLYSVPPSGGAPSPVVIAGESEGLGGSHPCFLEGGALLYVDGDGSDASLFALDPSGTRRRELLRGHDNFAVAAPGGWLLLAAGNQHLAAPFSERDLELLGEPRPIAERWERNGHYANASRDGTLVYEEYAWGQGQLVWRDRDGRRREAVGEPMTGLARPILSPDGTRIVVTAREGASGGAEANLWVLDVENRTNVRVTSSGASEPAWSPDGAQIVFRGADGRFRLALSDRDVEPRLLEWIDKTGYAYEWTAKGNLLIASGWSPGAEGHIWSVKLTPHEAVQESVMVVDNVFDTTAPDLSPDGRFLAYQSDETGRPEIFVQQFPSGAGKTRVSTRGGAQPRWRADGGEIYFVEGEDLLVAAEISLAAEQIRVGARTELFREPTLNARGHNYDVSADGTRFLVIETVEPGRSAIRVIQNWQASLQL